MFRFCSFPFFVISVPFASVVAISVIAVIAVPFTFLEFSLLLLLLLMLLLLLLLNTLTFLPLFLLLWRSYIQVSSLFLCSSSPGLVDKQISLVIGFFFFFFGCLFLYDLVSLLLHSFSSFIFLLLYKFCLHFYYFFPFYYFFFPIILFFFFFSANLFFSMTCSSFILPSVSFPLLAWCFLCQCYFRPLALRRLSRGETVI